MEIDNSKDEAALPVTSVAISLLLAVSVFCVFYLNPVIYIGLIAEDCWGEYATIVLYITALLLLLYTMFSDRRYVKPGFILLALCFFFMAMEEMSWGQRIIGLQTPELLEKMNRQSEINIHNLVKVNRLLQGLAVIIIFWAVVLPILTRKYQQIESLVNKFGIPIAHNHLWPYFVVASFFIIAKPLPRVMEVGELLLGFSFLLYSYSIFSISQKNGVAGTLRSFLQLAGIGIFVVSMTIIMVTNWPNSSGLRIRYCQFAINELPERKFHAQSEAILGYLVRNQDFMTVELLSELNQILKHQTAGISKENLINDIVASLSTIDDDEFCVYRVGEFNLRGTNTNERRAQLLFVIAGEYSRLGDAHTAAKYYSSSLQYTDDDALIEKLNLVLLRN